MSRQEQSPNPNRAQAELCRRSFFYFLTTFWDVVVTEPPVYNWHIEYLCNELQEVLERVIRREPKLYDLIINVPPGSTKSTICTVMLPVWAWIRDPKIRTLTASYAASLSVDHSTKSRDVVKSDKFKQLFPEVAIRRDFDNKSHYKNLHGGERLAAGIGGSLTGFHAHCIVVDDPLNPKEAASEADRTTANDFMKHTLSTRKVDKEITPIILVMQRLHQKDCTGDMLERMGKQVRHICLPGEASKDIRPPELIDRYHKNELGKKALLDPKRLSNKVLEKLREELGSYGYAGQIMQTPAPLDGGIWQKWIIPIDDNELDKLLPKMQRLGSDWDLAYTEKEQNSASAYVTAGRHEEAMYIDDIGFVWAEFPKLIAYMTARRSPHYIENKASGKSAKQVLYNQGINAVEVKVQGGDKIARATMATPYAESGRVFCRRSVLEKLYNDNRQGILLFPNGEHDDVQDALVQAINRLLGKRAGIVF